MNIGKYVQEFGEQTKNPNMGTDPDKYDKTIINNYENQVMKIIQKHNGVNRTKNGNFSDVLDNIDNYKPIDEDPDGEVEEKVSIILTVITNIGMILAVLMLAIIGVKYMLGSLEERSEYKKDMVPYLIGAFLLFGITTIVKVLQQLGQSINNI